MDKATFIARAQAIHGDKFLYDRLPDQISSKERVEIGFSPDEYHLVTPYEHLRNATGGHPRRSKRPRRIPVDRIKASLASIEDPELLLDTTRFIGLSSNRKSTIFAVDHTVLGTLTFRSQHVIRHNITSNARSMGANRLHKAYMAWKAYTEDGRLSYAGKYEYEEFHPGIKSAQTPISITCLEHQLCFRLPLSRHVASGKGGGCPVCSQNKASRNELLISEYLRKRGIAYDYEVTVDGLISPFSGAPLRFDFYLPEYDMFIEYDGEQHFMPVCFGGIPMEKAEENFRLAKRRDEVKDEWCRDNGRFLVRIPYTVPCVISSLQSALAHRQACLPDR